MFIDIDMKEGGMITCKTRMIEVAASNHGNLGPIDIDDVEYKNCWQHAIIGVFYNIHFFIVRSIILYFK